MQKLIEIIKQDYHPEQKTFFRVKASELIERLGVSVEELDAQWAEIDEALKQENLLILPALPAASEDECVRIFRRDSLLAQVLVETLFPTAQGDSLLARAIAALAHRPRQDNRHRQAPAPNSGVARPAGRQQPRRPPKEHRQQANKPTQQQNFEAPDPTSLSSHRHYTRPLE